MKLRHYRRYRSPLPRLPGRLLEALLLLAVARPVAALDLPDF